MLGSPLPLTMRLLAGLVLCLAAVGASASLYTEGGDVVVIASSADLKATLKPGAGALVEFYAPWQVPGSGSPELRCWGPAGGALILRRAQGVVNSALHLPVPLAPCRRCRRLYFGAAAAVLPRRTPDLSPCQRVSRLACFDTASTTAAAFAHGGCRRCMCLLGAAAAPFRPSGPHTPLPPSAPAGAGTART